ncbi:uncharacterized protein LOC111065973 isoform X5 [Drosophila obscura]|uniref:uncharacterized protein LOC111065973 isoform X5 n=1 Tax=Drosophila obscura TaxID=7282 RepID=UPI001BB2D05D|nr:uncharacterized protein LOC111065973 isoform X5 [Drosophila obscura]
MPPMWYQLIKILVLLFALFTTIVCINSEISKRREAEAAAAAAAAELAALAAAGAAGHPPNPTDMSDFMSDNLLHILRNKAKENQGKENPDEAERKDHQLQPEELPAKDLNQILTELFVVTDDAGVHLFNTTTTDNAPLMPIHTMIDQSQTQQPTQAQPQPQPQSKPQSKATVQATATAKPLPSISQPEPTRSILQRHKSGSGNDARATESCPQDGNAAREPSHAPDEDHHHAASDHAGCTPVRRGSDQSKVQVLLHPGGELSGSVAH